MDSLLGSAKKTALELAQARVNLRGALAEAVGEKSTS
jgi:hypothetical protein